MYTNADSLSNKMNDLLIFINSLNQMPNIIVVTEVNTKNWLLIIMKKILYFWVIIYLV